MANTFLFYAAGLREHTSGEFEPTGLPLVQAAKQILDIIWTTKRDDLGVTAVEEREDYRRYYEQEVYVPNGVNIRMPNGDVIKPGITFLDIRSKLKREKGWEKIEAYRSSGIRLISRWLAGFTECLPHGTVVFQPLP
jgi:hypothetical protein